MKRFFKKTVSLLCVVLLFVVQFSFLAQADTYPQMAVITKKSGANIYSLPGTTGHEANEADRGKSQRVATIPVGTKVKVWGVEADGDGDKWYKITFGENFSREGYLYTPNAELVAPEYTEDADFEKFLTEQAFPESYKVKLRSLHALYPNWVFYADHVNDDWNTVLSKMSVVGEKLVHGDRDDAWKSMEKGAYDWTGGDWIRGFDSGDWVAVDSRVVAYHLDPRNFLTSEYVFMFYNQGLGKNDNKATLQTLLNGTFMAGALEDNPNRTYADVLWDAGQSAKVSPYTLAAVIRQELGISGTSPIISGTVSGYEGIYNYYNIGAYANNGMTAVQRGLWWAKGASNGATTYSRPWNTREKALMGGAQYYGEDYVSVGQNTLYYKNFNVYKNSKYDLYKHQYATNIEDTKQKTANLRSAYFDVLDEALEFHIPVYKNMPDYTVLPTSNTSNDRFLKAISVNGVALANFDRYTYSYDYIVDKNTSKVSLKAVASDTNATVTGDGEKELNEGDNLFTITVKSSSGLTTEYTVNIFREKSGQESVIRPSYVTDYVVKEYITGVQPETAISTFKGKFKVNGGSYKIYEASGKEKTDGYISTGDTVRIFDSSGKEYVSIKVVIYGDVNGDGKINSTDRLRIRKHILKESELTTASLHAADANRDGKVNSTDRLRIRKHILKESEIKQ